MARCAPPMIPLDQSRPGGAGAPSGLSVERLWSALREATAVLTRLQSLACQTCRRDADARAAMNKIIGILYEGSSAAGAKESPIPLPRKREP